MSADNDPINRLDTTRRRLLLAGGALGVSALSPMGWRNAVAAGATEKSADNGMHHRPIPATGEPLAVMGLGSSGTFAYADEAERAALSQVLARFVALGGQMVDTSPTYGNAEVVIGELARARHLRDALFMATKVHINGREAGMAQMAESRQRLGAPIDLMQVHNFVDLDTQWATLKDMKAAGQVRYIGITHYRTSAFARLAREMRDRRPDFVQFNYSILTPDAETTLLPLARDLGIAVIINRAFNNGQFFQRVGDTPLPAYAAEIGVTSWAQFALKYVLGNRAVNVVIPATSDPAHLVDNTRAGYGPLPDERLRQRMRQTVAALG